MFIWCERVGNGECFGGNVSNEPSNGRVIEFANKAKDKMPASLDEDKARFEGYQKSMQELIDTAAEAKALAAEGKLEEAKVVAKKLNQLKKIGHNEYK